MSVYDTFLFYNEFNLLNVRFFELGGVVDFFCLMESDRTFSGLKKPFHFEKNRPRFDYIKDKIIAIQQVGGALEDPRACWMNERGQRETIYSLLSRLPDDAIIVHGDIDEIPRPGKLQEAIDQLQSTGIPQVIEMEKFMYRFDLKFPNSSWLGPFVVFKKQVYNINQMRHDRDKFNIIKNGGWHYGYLGSFNTIKNKCFSFSHLEIGEKFLTEEDKIKESISKNIDFTSKEQLVQIDITEENSPRFVFTYQNEFKKLGLIGTSS